jgi:hypothetical protein
MSFAMSLLPTSLCLEIPDRERRFLGFSTAGAQWRATINQMCLDAIIPWLQGEYAQPVKVQALPNVWEFVNGTKVECEDLNLVMVPSTALDQSELRVPQEWVDIPSWRGDYYFAVRVNPQENWLTIWGYTTHHQLKTQGKYDAGDRTYSLNEDHLIHDINVLLISQQLADLETLQPETLQSEVAPIPLVPIAQARNLLERLGDPAVIFPRLSIPFSLWAGLMAHSGWRQQLYRRRQGNAQQSILQWLQLGLSSWAEQSGWEIAGANAWSTQGVRSRELEPELGSESGSELGLRRSLIIAEQPYELRIFPNGAPESNTWRFELRSAAGLISPGITLRLLSEDLQSFEHNEDRAEEERDRLYVDVMLEPGEGLVWEIEPTPDGYLQEILYF